jgi:hypothetical protein
MTNKLLQACQCDTEEIGTLLVINLVALVIYLS